MNRKPYMRPVSATRWYFRHPRYLRYMSRELTCVFIGAFAWVLVYAVERLSEGQAAYESFLAVLKGPWITLGLLVLLAFAVHNATSWFNVTPKAMPVQLGERFLPASVIIAVHYGVWAVATLGVLLLAGVW